MKTKSALPADAAKNAVKVTMKITTTKTKYYGRSKENPHKLECRTIQKPILESFCLEPKCKFYKKPAAQGVCYTVLPRYKSVTQYFDMTFRHAEEVLAEMKRLRNINKQQSKDAWIKHLENQFICNWANHDSTLDMLIELRAENAKLKIQLGKWRK